MNETLGNDLKAAREAAGLTRARSRRRSGVSRQDDQTRWENGVFQPSTLLALKLARGAGRPVESLFWIVD